MSIILVRTLIEKRKKEDILDEYHSAELRLVLYWLALSSYDYMNIRLLVNGRR